MPYKNPDRRIYPLTPEVTAKIAAGEVVEGPKSVFKELVENSVDAGSTQINIMIEQGGIGLIRVQDNGCGIYKDDLSLALVQHATSKIAQFSDLEQVCSFGFRGEALASIASVSRLKLRSYVSGEKSGWEIQKAGREGEMIIIPVSKIPGTTVEVRDLFYNTPARRQFLRSEKTETLGIEEVFKRIALSQPSIGFSFQKGNSAEKQLPICRSQEAEMRRIAQLCGQSFAKNARYIEAESQGFKLIGWLAPQNQLRAQADLQYFYVNGRSVRDKVVNHAVRRAYQEQGNAKGYPAYILFFELDPSAVDVNVHPTKHEVRFREARRVHAFLSYSIREGLLQAYPTVEHKTQPLHTPTKTEWERSSAAVVLTTAKTMVAEPPDQKSSVVSSFIEKPLALLDKVLLIAENRTGLVVVDIQAAHRKLILATLKKHFKMDAEIPSRPLLMPSRMEFKGQSHLFESPAINFQALGFQWTPLGPESILIRTVPEVIHTLPNHFESFFKTLLALSHLDTALERIAEFVSQNHDRTLESAVSLWGAFQKIEHDSDIDVDDQQSIECIFQQFSVESLRALLATARSK